MLSLVAGAGVAVAAFGARRWAAAAAKLTGRLEATRIDKTAGPAAIARFEPRELEGLPAPVLSRCAEGRAAHHFGRRHHLQPVCDPGAVEALHVAETGRRRTPGFLWDADVAMLHGEPVRVRDAYIARRSRKAVGCGAGPHHHGRCCRRWQAHALPRRSGVVPDGFAAEPGCSGRRRRAAANATLVDGDIGVTLLFSFDDAGLIESVRAEGRRATVGRRRSWSRGKAAGRTIGCETA
jgi:hypothetical protein